jgi:ADP-heptose:LPS heptosyltransferase
MKARGPAIRSFRSIERWVKDRLNQLLVASMRQRRPPSSPNWSARRHRILVLRYDRLGDMVLSTGILKAIALAQPTVTIDVLASPRNAAVLDHNPYVGQVFAITPRRPWSSLGVLARARRAHYDAVLDVMVMAPSLTTMLLIAIVGARHRIGLGDRGNGSLFTLPVARLPEAEHYVDHSAALLAAFGVEPEAMQRVRVRGIAAAPEPASSLTGGWGIWRPEIFLTPSEFDEGEAQWNRENGAANFGAGGLSRLLVNVSAGSAFRYWPSEHFIKLLSSLELIRPRLATLIIGDPRDSPRMDFIGRASGVAVAHTPRARTMMALVATSDFVFTADTSVTHIASAFGKATVALFARGKEGMWGPYAVPGRVLTTSSQTLEALEVAPALQAVREVIAEASVPVRTLKRSGEYQAR